MRSKSMLLASTVVLCFLSAQLASAVVYAGSCRSGAYPTIQQAIDHAPVGGTVQICPGSYGEQLVITSSVTLKGGMNISNMSLTVLGFPYGGPVPQPSPYGLIAPIIQVGNSVTVTITNLTIYGNGSSCVNGYIPTYGVWSDQATTKLSNVVIRGISDADSCSPSSIWSGNGNISVQNSTIYAAGHLNAAAIYVGNSAATITGNTIIGDRNPDGILGIQTPVVVDNNATSGPVTISNNTLVQVGCQTNHCNSGTAIWVSGASGAVIAGNTIIPLIEPGGATAPPRRNDGIRISGSTGVRITGNKISNVRYGIVLTTITNSIVQSNLLTTAELTAIVVNDSGQAGGNIVTRNTIRDSGCGLSIGAAIGDTLTPNTYYASTNTC